MRHLGNTGQVNHPAGAHPPGFLFNKQRIKQIPVATQVLHNITQCVTHHGEILLYRRQNPVAKHIPLIII